MKDKLASVNWSTILGTLIVSGVMAYFASWVALERAVAVQAVRAEVHAQQNRDVLEQIQALRTDTAQVRDDVAQIRERLARLETIASQYDKRARNDR